MLGSSSGLCGAWGAMLLERLEVLFSPNLLLAFEFLLCLQRLLSHLFSSLPLCLIVGLGGTGMCRLLSSLMSTTTLHIGTLSRTSSSTLCELERELRNVCARLLAASEPTVGRGAD